MNQQIVLVHGAWVTPRCWDAFKQYFESHNYRCDAPAWPLMDHPVAALRESPHPDLSDMKIADIVDHYAAHILSLPAAPIIIGHSFGGLITQMLLDRGLGCVGVAIDSAPPRGVVPSARASLSALPVFTTWFGWNKVLRMSFDSFANNFANSLPPERMRPVYDEQIVPAPGRIYFQAALGLGNGVNFKNHNRPPLLLVSGGDDHTCTPSMVNAMLRKHRRSPVPVDALHFEGQSHWLIAEPGWNKIAGEIRQWIESAPATRTR